MNHTVFAAATLAGHEARERAWEREARRRHDQRAEMSAADEPVLRPQPAPARRFWLRFTTGLRAAIA